MNEYAKAIYKVPADIGRRVTVDGKPGIIVADRGGHIGVNFDSDRPNIISNCHPTWRVVYGEMGSPRKLTMSQKRYQRWLDACECFNSFKDFLLYETKQKKEVSK